MKKLLTLTLALALTLSLAACGSKADTPASEPSSTEPSSGTASTESTSTAPAPESTAAPAEDYPYTLAVQIKSPTTADIVLDGVTVKNDIEKARWGITFDNQYAVSLDVYEAGKYQCSTTKIVVDGQYTNYDLINPQISYAIGEGTLTIQADFTGAEGFDFNKVTTYTTEISEDGEGWKPTDFVAADVVSIADAPAERSMPATDESTASTPVASGEVKPIGEFYNGNDELLTITDSKISFLYDGMDYSVDYPTTPPEVVDNTMKKLIFTANGSQIELYYSPTDFTLNQTKSIQITVDGKPQKYLSRAKTDISAMAGTYKGQSEDVLTVSADNSFIFSSPKTGTITGTIPAGYKSGDKMTAEEYEIVLYYSSDYLGMTVDIRAADGNPVIGTDMVRE